ncbi:MAG: TetR/AcrR family transcriptional regulator [Candidatus Delongbacteria bacterium]|jgi:AcrR family transcriptional regulator|nr:TetR/AcrR family transcriptional regulator [Candidatus Delongbacteria bacterium]
MKELSERQQQILNTSISIIAQEGIQNLTTKNIASQIGVSEAALYRHYENKHAILKGILDMFKELSKMPEIPEGKELSPVEKIELFLMDRYTKFSTNPDLAKVMFSEAIFVNDKELADKARSIMHNHKEIIVKFIKDGMKEKLINKDLDPISTFRTVIGSMRLLVTQWCYNGNAFDLKKEGMNLWNNIKIMINP